MKKIGVVGTNGGWSSEMLADTVHKLTGYRLLIDPAKILLDLNTGKAWFDGTDLSELDGIVIKKVGARYSPDLLDRLEVLRLLYANGLQMFSSPLSILRVLDRLSCTVTLRLGGIPMPETTITEDVDAAVKTVEQYGEAVFKPMYTTKARGMEVIEAGPGAREAIERFKASNTTLYIQKKIDLNGKDMGVVFMGGEYITTYARCKTDPTTWNTTTHSGGKYEPYHPPQEIIELAHKAQSLFNLDFTCVDVAETGDGPIVFEVSAFGGFRGIYSTSDIDIAKNYVEYILMRIS